MSARRGEAGAAAVEAALVICFIVLPLTFGIITYAYMLSFRQTLSQAATEGARAAAVKVVTGDASARQSAQAAAARAGVKAAMATSTHPMECGTDHLTCTISFESCPNVDSGQCIKVRLSYPYSKEPLLPSFGLGILLPDDLGYTAVAGVS